jgi:hypothetical protein
MAAGRPPILFRVLLGASLALAAIPAGYGVRFAREWSQRSGLTLEEQRRSLGGIPYFRASFVDFAARLKQVIPPGEGVLVEPVPIRGAPTGPRWHLFLQHYAHPIEVYVRRPELGCVGFNYRAFVDYHLEHPELDDAERAALAERGVTWRLWIPVRWTLDGSAPRLERLVDGSWVEHPL